MEYPRIHGSLVPLLTMAKTESPPLSRCSRSRWRHSKTMEITRTQRPSPEAVVKLAVTGVAALVMRTIRPQARIPVTAQIDEPALTDTFGSARRTAGVRNPVAYADVRAFANGVRQRCGRDRQDGEIRHHGKIGDARRARQIADGRRRPVDRPQGTRKLELEQAAHGFAAHVAGLIRRPDDGNRARLDGSPQIENALITRRHPCKVLIAVAFLDRCASPTAQRSGGELDVLHHLSHAVPTDRKSKGSGRISTPIHQRRARLLLSTTAREYPVVGGQVRPCWGDELFPVDEGHRSLMRSSMEQAAVERKASMSPTSKATC